MRMYSSTGTVWRGKALAKDRRTGYSREEINDPFLCLYGTSVPQKYLEAIDYNNIEDGFVPRFLMFQSHENFPRINKSRELSSNLPPTELIEKIRYWTDTKRTENLLGGNIRTVFHTESTRLLKEMLEDAINEQHKIYQAKRLSAIWARAQEYAEKLSLIFSCSMQPDTTVMLDEAVEKAFSLVWHLCNQQMQRLDKNVADTEFQCSTKKVLRIIEGSQANGVPHTHLMQRTGIKTRDMQEIVQVLVDSGEIIPQVHKSNTKPIKMYYSTRFVKMAR